MGYTKLFNEIIMSTVWDEDKATRCVWITMLAMKDRWHVVSASVPGLARAARVSREECEVALKKLSQPDRDSRTKDFEGRRVESVDGGWLVLNGEKYRNKMSLDERREYNRIKQREYRLEKKSVKSCVQFSTESAHTDTDTDSDTKKNNSRPKPSGFSQKEVVEDFEKHFWPHVRRKERKSRARKEWVKLCKEPGVRDKMVAGIVEYAERTKDKEADKITHGANFLIDRRWEDEKGPREEGRFPNRDPFAKEIR